MNINNQLIPPHYIPKKGGEVLSVKEWYLHYNQSLAQFYLSFDEFVDKYLIQLF